MSSRHVKRTLVAFVALIIGAAAVLVGVLGSPAGASTLTSPDGITSLATQGTVAPQTPYSSGQIVNLQVAANTTLNAAALAAATYSGPIHFLECADPGGLVANLPTKPSQCEPGTIDTSVAASDGSLNLTGTHGYTILALPDPNLGSGNGLTCGYAPNQCVVGIFANQNDFTKPHLFSAPFVVSAGDGSDSGANPGDGTSTPVSITSAATTTFTTGTAGSFTVTGAGTPAPTSYSETGALPTGVTLSPSGVLSGTTTQTGNFPITITASDGVLANGTQSFTLSVVTTLTSADGLTGISTQGAVTAVTPYSSGQVISVHVAANPTLDQAALIAAGYPSGADPIKLVECADPNGLASNLPTKPSQCEAQTIDSNVTAGADGSINLTGTHGYSVLALPDPTLGASAITCGVAPNACVIGIFANQNDFSKPHLFSAPFQVSSNGGADNGASPGDGTSSANSAPTITSANSATFSAGNNASFQVTASGFPGSTFSESGALPAGVTLSPTGILSGTTSQPGTSWPITITASNGTSPNATQSFTLSVVSTLTSADGLTGLSTQGPITLDTPYSSGQVVSVNVAANPTLDQASLIAAGFPSGADPIKLVECADPNGLVANLPTKPSQCEAQTIDSNVTAAPNGSITLNGTNGYTVLALPDPTLGTSPITCSVAPNACVIGIFANQNDFSKPHLFSAPFQVSSNGGADNGANPGDGTSTANGSPTITSASSATFTQGAFSSFQVTASGFPGSTFTESGTLPSGVSLSTSGLLSGTPTLLGGVYPITIVASNGTLPQALQTFTLTVIGDAAAPTGVSATPGVNSAVVSFTAPTNNGGSAITSYTVTATDHTTAGNGGQSAHGAASPITVSGLTGGDSYTFTVVATNGFGTSVASAASTAVAPDSVPGAPTIGTATPGNATATVNWTAPASSGGTPVTGYVITPSTGSPVTVGNVTTATITGLTNGTSYTFTVAAINAVGTGSPSAPSNSVTPLAFAGPPTIGTATGGNTTATVTWTAPSSDGGTPITGYVITPSTGSPVTVGNVTTTTVTGLTNGTSYTFTVAAINAVGTGPNSAPSNTVTPATFPGAPTIGAATAGNGSARVSFTPPASNGGAAISTYTVTASDSTNAARGHQTASGASSPITVAGLTNGDSYSFTVTATNSAGTGPASGPSGLTTPVGTGLTIVQRSLPSVADGGSYNQVLTVLGATGAVKWTVTGGALPAKIKLGKTGTLGGAVKSGKHATPPGSYTFTVTATQKGKKGAPTLTATATFTIVVTAV